jgi:hypothetical protein
VKSKSGSPIACNVLEEKFSIWDFELSLNVKRLKVNKRDKIQHNVLGEI